MSFTEKPSNFWHFSPHRPTIIAEIGVNHNGDIELAKKLIEAAADAGAHVAKFQVFSAENLVVSSSPSAPYQTKNLQSDVSQLEMLKSLEIPLEQFHRLKAYCDQIGIEFLATPFLPQDAVFLKDIEVNAIKISSGDITNIPLLEKVADLGLPALLSTGMSTIEEIEEALQILELGCPEICLLHCVSSYPCPIENANLQMITTLRDVFERPVGYSDHTIGFSCALGAFSLGATVIEKHFTLNKNLKGPDHIASANPQELQMLVDMIHEYRNAPIDTEALLIEYPELEVALGDGQKHITDDEKINRELVRKSIVSTTKIPAGSKITSTMITCKRPGTGIAPKHYDNIINRIAATDINKDEVITWEMIEGKSPF